MLMKILRQTVMDGLKPFDTICYIYINIESKCLKIALNRIISFDL